MAEPTEIDIALQALKEAEAQRQASLLEEAQKAAAAAEAQRQAEELQKLEEAKRAADPAYDNSQQIREAGELSRQATIAEIEIRAAIDQRLAAGQIAKEGADKLREQLNTLDSRAILNAHANKAHVTALNALELEHAKATGKSFAANVPADPAAIGLNGGGSPEHPGVAGWRKLGLSEEKIEKLKKEFPNE